KLRPQDYLETLIKSKSDKGRDVLVCPQCGKENPKDKNFCVWCSVPLKDSLMTDTVKRFHADQEAQKEFEALKEKMVEMEKVMKVMVQLPGFKKLVEKAADLSSE
ncbi:MAG: hypothetical protein HXS44_08905, partial [Theionarchaea archaeon]|nr:hypothetical protein [Theionarchaea archaeon]